MQNISFAYQGKPHPQQPCLEWRQPQEDCLECILTFHMPTLQYCHPGPPGLGPCATPGEGEQEGRMKHPPQYLGGFDLVSTAAAPP